VRSSRMEIATMLRCLLQSRRLANFNFQSRRCKANQDSLELDPRCFSARSINFLGRTRDVQIPIPIESRPSLWRRFKYTSVSSSYKVRSTVTCSVLRSIDQRELAERARADRTINAARTDSWRSDSRIDQATTNCTTN